MKKIIVALGLSLIANASLATPLVLSAGSGLNIDACIFAGMGVGGCPIMVGSSGSAPAATPTGTPGQSYSGTSWTYTVDELITILSGDNQFEVVFDSNWAGSTPGDSEFLDLFQVLVNGVVEFDYLGGAALDFGANGTGNENWLLSTVDLSTFLGTDTVSFHMEMSELTDGAEQVGLLAAGFVDPPDPCVIDPTAPGCVIPTPEPGILLLFGTGLLGLALGRRRAQV